MAIEKMKKLRLMVVRSQREALLQKLQILGCVQITEFEPETEEPEITDLVRRESSDLLRARSKHASLEHAIELMAKYAPDKGGLLQARPEVARDEFLNDADFEKILELAAQIEAAEERIKRIAAEESRLRSAIESLIPWQQTDIPLDYSGTELTISVPGMLPPQVSFGEFAAAIEAVTDEAEAYLISADKAQQYVNVICFKSDYPAIIEAMRPFAFSAVAFTGMAGTAAENIKESRLELARLAAEKQAAADKIASQADKRPALKLCADRAEAMIAKEEAADRLYGMASSIILEGWIPAVKEAELSAIFDSFDCAWETEDPAPEELEDIPIKLKTGPLTRPMNMVTEMYSLPAYNGVDPNFLLLPSFALFFGIMFADMGYGLIMILAGLLIKYKMKARGNMGYMGGIALICGVSCVIFGAITGTFFGDIIPQVSAFFGGADIALPMLIDPLSDPMTILIICLVIGFIHMFIGTVVNFYMLVRDGQLKDALCDVGSVWLMFIGIALGALGITWYALYGALVVYIFTQGRSAPSIVGKIGSGLWELYNFVTGWFGDILSYCRLMALMLAGTVIAQVFNTLGSMTGNIIAFVVIFLVGHTLNFGLNIIGTFVHTSRLEYLEFFGKFYRDGGRPFEPLEIKTRYYDVLN